MQGVLEFVGNQEKMNAVSTPVRKSCNKCVIEPPGEITPIKTFHHLDSQFEGFDLDDSFETVNERFAFGDGKRKFGTAKKDCDGMEEESLPCSSHVKKKKVNGMETVLHNHSKTCNQRVNLSHLGNITPSVDIFEDEMFNDVITQSNTPKNNGRINSNAGQISSDIIENSYLGNDNGIFTSSMLINDAIQKSDGNATLNADGKMQTTKIKDFANEDSSDLSVFLKGNEVVDSILDTMNLDNDLDQITDESNKSRTVSQNEFNEILTESVLNWEKGEIANNPNDVGGTGLASRIKQRLLGNVNMLKTTKSETTGWSQMDDFTSFLDESMNPISQFQELGPFFGLPSKVEQLYEEFKGIKDLYTWQKECLTMKAVKEKKNLVYSLPTSGGKTLVAEILILRELLCYKRNVLFILPFVSIVQEKVHDLSTFALELGFLVEEYAAGKGVLPLRKRRKRRSVIIATIEKASAVVISLIETKQLEEFGLVVVDELHLISEDSGRGSTLESLLTHILHLGEKIQIIGMTATVGNLHELARFLKAESYTGSFRPVELKEFVKCGDDIFDVNWGEDDILQPVRSVQTSIGRDPDGISSLVLEMVPDNSVLIFCPTKKNCENVALLVAETMPNDLLHHREEERKSFLRALKSETNEQICPVLKKTIPYGVVYHHSGLTPGERKLLEEGFRAGTLTVICCTSTLAAGINLPAARVILRSPYVGRDFISLSKYKQMIGRAGRAGMGSTGESYLICQRADSLKVKELLCSKMDDAISKMNLDSLKSFILSSIGLGTATTRVELRNLISCTLIAVQAERLNVDIKKMIDACLSSLFKMGAIKVKEFDNEENVAATSKLDISFAKMESRSVRITNSSSLGVSRLGRAAMKGCIGLERAHELYGDFIKAQASLVLLTELHLLYLVTPYEMIDQIKPNYSIYFDVYMQLTAKELPAAKVIGVTEFVISKLAMGMKPKSISESVLNRFYVALILNEMLKQQNIWDVAKLFQVSAGMIQTLMTSTSTFANNVLRFCEELQELWSFKSLLKEFAPRLAHCCSSELLPLLELPAVKRGRAKQLYDAGYKTLQLVANADAQKMVKSVDHLPTRVARQIIAAARLLLLEKAENLKEEAEEVLQGLAEKIISG